MNNLESLGFEVKVNESKTNVSEHTLDLIDDKRAEIYQKRNDADTMEVDKFKRHTTEEIKIAQKVMRENFAEREEKKHKLIMEHLIKEYGKDINIPI